MRLVIRLLLINLMLFTIISHSYLSANETSENEILGIPVFPESKSSLGHIFRKINGHFENDTHENRKYILEAVAHPANKAGTMKQGVEVYFKIMPDGYHNTTH